jgi:hypothetical protein
MTALLPTLSQIEATARFHRKMERIFTAQGKTADAEAARKAAEELEALAKEMQK